MLYGCYRCCLSPLPHRPAARNLFVQSRQVWTLALDALGTVEDATDRYDAAPRPLLRLAMTWFSYVSPWNRGDFGGETRRVRRLLGVDGQETGASGAQELGVLATLVAPSAAKGL